MLGSESRAAPSPASWSRDEVDRYYTRLVDSMLRGGDAARPSAAQEAAYEGLLTAWREANPGSGDSLPEYLVTFGAEPEDEDAAAGEEEPEVGDLGPLVGPGEQSAAAGEDAVPVVRGSAASGAPLRADRQGYVVQTLVFPRTHWADLPAVRKWAREHGFKATKVDATSTSWRLRQRPPGDFKRIRPKCINPGDGEPGPQCRVLTLGGPLKED